MQNNIRKMLIAAGIAVFTFAQMPGVRAESGAKEVARSNAIDNAVDTRHIGTPI
jgi:hypothetical protein